MSNIPANFTDGVFTITDDNSLSATLLMSNGDQALSGLVTYGRAQVVTESRGAVVGLRKGARAFPTISVSATLAGPAAAFQSLALGKTATAISTTLDIGDLFGVDFNFSFDYGAETRSYSGEDMVLTSMEITEGEVSTISFEFTVYGPLSLDAVVVIAAR
jgi:hypothetical protein